MDASPIRHPRLARAPLLGSALLLVLLALLGAATVHAQDAGADPPLQIVGVLHDPAGTITLTVTPPPDGSNAERFSALVDRVSATVSNVVVPTREGASIVIAIDTSGSMAGAPIASAHDAARRLVDRLGRSDSLAIVGFAAEPTVLSGFTTDRETTQAALSVVDAVGDTTLYDAVALSSELLQARPDGAPRVLVLLSDGQNSGADDGGRDASIAQVAADGAIVHAFDLGAQADEAYLGALADATDGSYSGVASEELLGALFELLGEQLSSTWQVEISVPPLPSGAHHIELNAILDGEPVRRETSVVVDNAGLVSATVAAGGDPEFVVIDIATAVPARLLRIEASVGDVPVVYSAGRLFIDSWASDAGAQTVRIDIFLGDKPAATTAVAITVPELEPELSVNVDLAGTPPFLFATGRAQGFDGQTLRVLADGAEVATTDGRELRVDYPIGLEVTVELVSPEAGGEPLKSEVFTPQGLPTVARAGSGFDLDFTYPLIVAAALIAGAIGFFVLRRRRARRCPSYRTQRRFRAPRDLPGRPTQNGPIGTVRVFGPNGHEQVVALGFRAITIGSSRDCDVVIEGDGIQPLHARLSARGNGEFQIHGLATQSSRPFDDNAVAEWAVLRAGESLALGLYEITIVDEPHEQQLESA